MMLEISYASPLVDQPPQSILNLKITHLLGFLGQYQAICPNLQMICPWDGVPLPSIDIKLGTPAGLDAKIELSVQLSKALIQYMGGSRIAAAKISH
jgi:hypothetical protein